MKKVFQICDTTLRDGEQMPGVVFKPKQKMELAQKISNFGADYIELMPSISASESEVTKLVVDMGLSAEITASTMLRKKDIDLAVSCNVDSITLFSPLSDLHLKTKLGINRKENLQSVFGAIDYARSYGMKIHFAGEDSTRADIDYVISFVNSIAPYIGYFLVCDTVGCHTPEKSYSFFKEICKKTRCSIGLHGHNDFGLATANTIAGLSAGASIFSGTFTGIGERSGNVAIEEVCTALRFLYNIDLGVKYEDVTQICRLVEKYSGVSTQPHKPIIGTNSFSHESGIHVAGVIKDPRTYEPFDPVHVGQERRLIFGKHSGKKLLRHILGGQLSEDKISDILEKIKSTSESEKRAVSLDEVIEIQKKIDVEKGI